MMNDCIWLDCNQNGLNVKASAISDFIAKGRQSQNHSIADIAVIDSGFLPDHARAMAEG